MTPLSIAEIDLRDVQLVGEAIVWLISGSILLGLLDAFRVSVARKIFSPQRARQNMKTKKFRQGDVLIEQVAQIPTDAVKQKPRGRIILAHGEATGHHHSIADIDAADWWKRDDGSQFLEIKDKPVKLSGLNPGDASTRAAKSISHGALLVHEEHRPIALPPGKYRVTRQREYSPEAIRNVQD